MTTITITVPDKLAKAVETEAAATGSTLEQYLLATLAERVGSRSAGDIVAKDQIASPLLRLIGIAKGGPSDSSVNHDYRPGDPV